MIFHIQPSTKNNRMDMRMKIHGASPCMEDTIPEELNPIINSNQKFLYTALYHAASDTLSELAADSKYLGTDIGYICILHTWGSTMNFHPHIHAIVLGGGLDVKNHWKDNGKEFFLPIKVISKIFRGKYSRYQSQDIYYQQQVH